MLQDTAIQIASGTVVIPDASRYLQEYSGCDGTCSGTITTGLPVAQHADVAPFAVEVQWWPQLTQAAA